LFVTFPLLLRNGVSFWLSLSLASTATAISYFGMVKLLPLLGVKLD
jgi:hypothetical protein